MNPADLYLSLMQTIRVRLDVVEILRNGSGPEFVRAESAAFHGRKVIEAIAFACLVALDNSFEVVPRDAKGQWNAEDIFNSLQRKNLGVFPSPSVIRAATLEEEAARGVLVVIDGVPERRLTHADLVAIYKRLHAWLHEVNPYTSTSQDAFCATRAPELWIDLFKLHSFVERHVMSIRGAGFFCVLRDKDDQTTKVLPIYRESAGPTGAQAVAADNLAARARE